MLGATAKPNHLVTFFEANGYLVLENAFNPAEIEELKQETTLICRGDRGQLPDHPKAGPAEPDASVLNRFLCIHFPHKCSDVMRRAIHNQPTVQTLSTVIGPNVKCMQWMLFIKSSGKPGQALPPMEIDGQSWPGWELPSRKTPGDGEILWVLELLSSNGGRLMLDLRRREGDPTEILSALMGIQMAAKSRGGKLKFRLSESVLKALLSASMATVLDIVD